MAEVTESWLQLSIENEFRRNFCAGQVFAAPEGIMVFDPFGLKLFIDFGCLKLRFYVLKTVWDWLGILLSFRLSRTKVQVWNRKGRIQYFGGK